MDSKIDEYPYKKKKMFGLKFDMDKDFVREELVTEIATLVAPYAVFIRRYRQIKYDRLLFRHKDERDFVFGIFRELGFKSFEIIPGYADYNLYGYDGYPYRYVHYLYRKPERGVDDFETLYPQLAKEWHPIKNDFRPDSITPFYNQPVWWKCSRCGHEYQSRPRVRVEYEYEWKRYTCPVCNQKIKEFRESSDVYFGYNKSILEYYTDKILMKYKYTYRRNVRFKHLTGVGGGLLSYDFVIYDNDKISMFVECQGIQHYYPICGKKQYIKQMIHDACKQFYAQVREIPLITIPYVYDEMDIEEMFQR